ncbi:hypothetical protein D3C71_1598710 [compost metagenome]
MDQPGVQRHPIEERLEGRAGRAHGTDHVDMAKASGVVDVHRSQVGTHGHGFCLDHQNRRRGVLRQTRAPAQQQVFKPPLQVGVEGGANQRRAVRAVQPPRQQRRQARLQAWRQQQGFFQGLIDRRLRPHPVRREPAQHFVARGLRTCRLTVRTQATRRLWQHRQ